MNANRNNMEIQKYFFSSKIEKNHRVTPSFFSIFDEKFIFEFSGYYDCNSSRDTKKEEKRCPLLHNLIERPKNANEKRDSRRTR